MSSTDEVTFDAPAAPKPAKKKAVKKRRAAAKPAVKPAAEKSSAPFPGLTRTLCADACNAKGCAVSGAIYCGHPCKGGLQGKEMADPEALKRLNLARDQIDVRFDPNRFK